MLKNAVLQCTLLTEESLKPKNEMDTLALEILEKDMKKMEMFFTRSGQIALARCW